MKRQCISVLAGVMTAALLAGGCGQAKTAEPESAPAPTVAETPAPTATEVPEEPLNTIGEEKAGEYVYSAILKNETGRNITGFAVKDDSLEEYPENLLQDGDVYVPDEERILYYDAEPVIRAFEERAAAAAENAASDAENAESESSGADSGEMQEEDLLLYPGYDVRLTFDDGNTTELHMFPFGDIEEGSIHVGEYIPEAERAALNGSASESAAESAPEEEKLPLLIGYLTYRSVSTGQMIDTKEAEEMAYELSAAEAAASEEEKQEEEAEEEKEEEKKEERSGAKSSDEDGEEKESSGSSSSDTSSSDSGKEESKPTPEPEPEPESEPEPEPEPESEYDDGDGGCGDGDFIFN